MVYYYNLNAIEHFERRGEKVEYLRALLRVPYGEVTRQTALPMCHRTSW